jgi:excisionase family DNA binding protein
MTHHEPWVDTEQVAAHLGVQKHSIYRWIEERGFPVHRAGRLLRFKLSEVDEWMRSGVGGGKDQLSEDGPSHASSSDSEKRGKQE